MILKFLLKYQPLQIAKILQYIKSFPKGINYIVVDRYDIELNVSTKYMKNIFYYLKQCSMFKYESISDIVGSDNFTSKYRFRVIYNLLSFAHNARLKISVYTNETIALVSLSNLYKSALWQEREIWDLFGVLFSDHADLRRILTDYGFFGHALRKDFPLSGFIEIYYNDNYKYIGIKPVSLAQEYRKFNDFKNPWK